MLESLMHFNSNISEFVNGLGPWFYILLFFIIFCETGSIFGIFFPGDSLLFTVGLTAAATGLNIHFAVLAICLGAILGDSCNYITGKLIGDKFFTTHARVFKTAHLIRTKKFMDKHGNKAILFSRFIAFVRTLTPFVAGIGRMNYPKFVLLGVISAIIWSFSITYTVYFFSDNDFVRENLTTIIMLIVIFVAIQTFYKYISNKIKAKKT
ncbi:VTT domain-containing protein [Francisella adeliensis]|uniref:VTT domain-containing protein n=1 Tax=Francisella adeliensis TaxID=2007306 RepID=A0A2Z4XY44_9GAMM|nr:VTT domain-containing protein [Francisella adeliensis]AXA33670.1 hypothetical protein CDH04_04250 [Francisella adeliensis]MBK2085562.1 VTT domain-containing protein [Francisella adeliensis]MBK2097440.1 VTT domain-containing protein [Francisella adeliensis]QIW11903.1 hypothetical protein FZC43_04255 [Francisella adeliensis]QIW13779.1 hypothetical protein FZC44_04255 [Francisella adeliensis]